MKICAIRKRGEGHIFKGNFDREKAKKHSAELAFYIGFAMLLGFVKEKKQIDISKEACKKLSEPYKDEYLKLMKYHAGISIKNHIAKNAMLFGSSHTWYVIELALLASTKN